jgi:hypothetical protein
MSWMREFITEGMNHWQRNGESPCGAVPYPELGEGTTLFGWSPPRFVFPQDCPICIPTRTSYFKLLRNGGSMSGWDIRPNEDREDASAYKAGSEDAGG